MALTKKNTQNLIPESEVILSFLNSLSVTQRLPEHYAQFLEFDIQLLEQTLEERNKSFPFGHKKNQFFLHAPKFQQ